MDTTELLKKVRRIEIKTRGISNQLFSGEYHSAFKGRGMSFSEVRGYQYGDDVRSIDWNVTARLNEPYIKVFEEERELTVMMMVDLSGSAFFGTTTQFKTELMTELSAVLAFSAITNNDKVGLLLFTSKVEKFIPPKKGKTHILRIIRELVEFEPGFRQTNVSEALQYLNRVLKKRTIVFLLSDFLDEDYHQPLNIAARKHDVIGMRISDPREERLPDSGLMLSVDEETGQEVLIDTSSPQVRHGYDRHIRQRMEYFRDSFRKAGADQMTLHTGQDYVRTLMGFFKKREMRR